MGCAVYNMEISSVPGCWAQEMCKEQTGTVPGSREVKDTKLRGQEEADTHFYFSPLS